MTIITRSFFCAAMAISVFSFPVVGVSTAQAQATCRAKCTSQEQACLKRTSNKGQCGRTASVCMSKCK